MYWFAIQDAASAAMEKSTPRPTPPRVKHKRKIREKRESLLRVETLMRVIKFGTVVFLPTDTRPANATDDVLKNLRRGKSAAATILWLLLFFSEGDKKNSSKRPKECDK